ncbi:MAG: helix-turn-helix transcriptional regulator [Pseudomonas sp.]|uniref:helix-turn-helix domain-containing protein n=1 Tax=Pseudomonas sp. TaxID=306 RepID=UPI003395496A
MASNQVWARRLRAAREAKGLSQKQLGIEAGLDPSVASTRINRYEMGVHRADQPITQKVAEVLNIPVAYLYADYDGLAELILTFERATAEQKAYLLEVAARIRAGSQ